MDRNKPGWILRYESKGKKATKIGKNYYLYKISSRWDSKKKRAVKITEKYLGKVTKDGIIPPKHERVKEMYNKITVKEYGATYFLQYVSQDILTRLKEVYPNEWKELFCLSVFRLMEKSPLKRMNFYYKNSYISEAIKDVRTSGKFLGKFMREIGVRRESMKEFMGYFMIDTEYAVIDLTNIFSYSKNVISAMLGHNKDKVYKPQINLVLIYSLDKLQPVYFRYVPGSIRDVSAFIKTVNETITDNFILIGDKGLHSDDNVDELIENEIDYVLALKRDSNYIKYENIRRGDRNKFDGYFLYQKKQVWFYSEQLNNKNNGKSEWIITYLDLSLKAEEENDLAIRITKLESKSKDKGLSEREKEFLKKYKGRLYKTPYRNGTLSIRTSLNKSSEEVYSIMKSRVNVEQVFDTFKNTLEADKSYMRDDKQIGGWLFVNFIALQLYYKIYAILLNKKMLNNYSPVDVLTHLKRIYLLKIKDNWQTAEVPKKSRSVVKKLEIKIPIT